MNTIYLLCEWDESRHGQYDAVSWYDNEADAEAEAERLAWDHYTREVARIDRGYEPVSPDKTKYRQFFVLPVDKAVT